MIRRRVVSRKRSSSFFDQFVETRRTSLMRGGLRSYSASSVMSHMITLSPGYSVCVSNVAVQLQLIIVPNLIHICAEPLFARADSLNSISNTEYPQSKSRCKGTDTYTEYCL